jgi:hypothetical protein
MVKAAPEDPSALQLLCNDAERKHRNGDAVPDSLLIQDQLVGAAPLVDLMSYFSVGSENDTAAAPGDWVGASKLSVLSSGERFSLLHHGVTYTGVKSGKVRISGWPAFAIKDYGSVLEGRRNSCIFLAIGIAGLPFELDPLSYMKSVITELSRSDIDETKVSDYALLRQQVESGSKILLTGLVHFGLPRHVAALVVQRSDNGEHRCVLFTCGQPKYVMVCYIEDNHIMPGVWADCPDGLMSYEQFERFWTPYTLRYPDHVKITHLGTVLTTKFQFGNGPSGILVGGSNTATWDLDILDVTSVSVNADATMHLIMKSQPQPQRLGRDRVATKETCSGGLHRRSSRVLTISASIYIHVSRLTSKKSEHEPRKLRRRRKLKTGWLYTASKRIAEEEAS